MMKRSKRKMEPDQGWSWVVLLAAFFCSMTFDGIVYSFGVFYLEFLDHFQEGRARTAWIGSVISGTYAIVGPVASVLASKFGCRLVTMSGALLASLGFILSTFSTDIISMIFTFSVMGGIGFGMMYLCAYVMIGHYFEKYRALATGIASCGSGIGMFVFAPLSVLLIESFTWKGAMWITAGAVLNGVVMGALFRPFPPTIVAVADDDKEIGDGKQQKKKNPALIDLKLLVSPVFMLISVSSLLCMIGFFIPFIYLPDYACDIGLSRGQGAILLSIIGITNTIGRILCGFISDKPWTDPLKIHNGALILGGAVTMCCCWIKTFPLLCVYAATFGSCIAAYISLTPIILVEFLGLDRLCSSFGLLMMFRGISTFIGAPLAGILFDASGTYDVPFYAAGAVIICSGLICLPLRLVQRSDCDYHQSNITSTTTTNSHQLCSEKKPLTEAPPYLEEARLGVALDKHKQLLCNNRSLYSSMLQLSGSQISISLPNPYISQGQQKEHPHPHNHHNHHHDTGGCDNRTSQRDITAGQCNGVEKLRRNDSKLSQSDSCLCSSQSS